MNLTSELEAERAVIGVAAAVNGLAVPSASLGFPGWRPLSRF
jgi:hypothetical protein